ncbi:cupin domain-containing protein [Telluribacter sp.]|jgi:quercetin 2,3-dioxygenase|uniref:cupin domain-containing protein n=1 Tax=Telluribacter sp. TaxID=1978767 RepID=UPI002E1378CF|nr:cupin domain-containing protein [Telluribacter sp.]
MKRREFIQTSLVTAPLVSVSSIVLGADNKPATKSFTIRRGEDRFKEPIKYRGVNPNLVKISAKDTAGLYSVFEYEGIAKMGPDMHVHFKQDETFYVLEGEFLFQVGNERQTLVAGDTIFLPRNVPHTWLQLSDRGKLMYLLQPAGKMEEFFKKMNSLEGKPTAEVVQKIHLAHDLKVVGPPLTV